MARIPGPLFRQRLWPLPAAMAHFSFHPHAGGGKRPHYLDLNPDYFGFHPIQSKLIPDYPDFSGFVNTEIGNAAVPAAGKAGEDTGATTTGNAAVPAAGKAGEDTGATITGNAAVPAAGKAGEDTGATTTGNAAVPAAGKAGEDAGATITKRRRPCRNHGKENRLTSTCCTGSGWETGARGCRDS